MKTSPLRAALAPRSPLARGARFVAAAALVGGASFARADDLPNLNAKSDAPVVAGSEEAARGASALGSFVAARDEQRGTPTFLFAIRDAARPSGVSLRGARLGPLGPEKAALLHLEERASLYGLSHEAIAHARMVRLLDVGRGGIVAVLRQRVRGADVFRSDAKVLMNRDLDLVAIGGSLDPAAVDSAKLASFLLSPEDALAAAFGDALSSRLAAADFVDTKEKRGDAEIYSLAPSKRVAATGVAMTDPSRVWRVYYPLPDRLVPAYALEVLASAPGSEPAKAYSYVIAADDGRILLRENLVHADAFQYRVWAETSGDDRPLDGPLADDSPYPFQSPNGSYPGFTPPNLVSMDGFDKFADPWLPPGATSTRGNAVDAYTDDDAPDGFSSGDLRASVTSPNTFDWTYDVALGPQANDSQRQAAVTDLFYVDNWLHDWWYDSGFDEAGGNAQKSNLGRGGVEGDPLLAEGQNGAPQQRNNSNMSVPADGISPRMQMLVWDGAKAQLTVQPGNTSYVEGQADFGPSSFLTTGTLVVADDGANPTDDACQPIVDAVAGNIALVHRGNCSFKSKAVRAESAGAIGVILIDDMPGQGAPHLFDDPATTTPVGIPMVSVSSADGASLEATVMTGPTSATLRSAVDVDGTIDNTVIAHEWGHYLHLRNVACGSPACSAESEGWGDFNALMLIVRPTDDVDGAYAMAQYATIAFPDPAYFGIRRYPYSVDFAKNPLTFKNIMSAEPLPTSAPVSPIANQSNNAEAHAAGEVWASMLFQSYVGLLKNAESPAAPYTFDEARRRMGDYVVAGMTLAPADPTYLEQRDGLLAAAAAADPGDLAILAKGFADRGAGTCAVSPPRDSTDFAGVVESFDVVPNVAIDSIEVDDGVSSCDGDGYLDAGEVGNVTVHMTNTGPMANPSVTATVTTSTPGVTFPNGATIDFGAMDIFSSKSASIAVALDPSVVTKGILELRVTSDEPGCADSAKEEFFVVAADEVPGSSTADDVEPKATAWTTKGTKEIWSRDEGPDGNHVWSGVDFSSPSDAYLVSPELTVSATEPLVLHFKHRHSFESSQGTDWDGGVIEVSVSGGSWNDISQYGDPGYGGTIGDAQGNAMNKLKGRDGYVGTNASWPDTDDVAVDMGMSLAGQTIAVRFRVASDDAVGNVGWQIDDIAFDGITNTPFASLVDDPGKCVPPATSTSTAGSGGAGGVAGDIEPKGDGCACEATGSREGGAPFGAVLAIAGAAWVGARRRSARTGVARRA